MSKIFFEMSLAGHSGVLQDHTHHLEERDSEVLEGHESLHVPERKELEPKVGLTCGGSVKYDLEAKRCFGKTKVSKCEFLAVIGTGCFPSPVPCCTPGAFCD